MGETNSSNEPTKYKVSILAALESFQVLCKHSYGYHKISDSKWRSLLQSTFAKLIDISKTGNNLIINLQINYKKENLIVHLCLCYFSFRRQRKKIR